jgi:lipopolysaccharide transport protein LptA
MRPAPRIIILLLILCGCASSPPVATPPRTTSVTRDPMPECFRRRTAAITVDADAMQSFDDNRSVTFTGNVVACQGKLIQYADRLEVFFDDRNDSIVRTVANGNVRVLTGDCVTASARRAVYDGSRDRLVLSGGVRVWDGDDVERHERFVIELALAPAGPRRCDRVQDRR